MKLAIASDHAGYDLKTKIIEYLKFKNHEIKDYGTNSPASCDYPDFVHPLCLAIENQVHDYGILICGSGIGVSIAANKHKNIRCALCFNAEVANLSRKHNNANVMSLAARFLSTEKAYEIIDSFLTSEFEGGRHQCRIDKISKW